MNHPGVCSGVPLRQAVKKALERRSTSRAYWLVRRTRSRHRSGVRRLTWQGPMNTHPELEAEQRYLDAAYERVEELRDAARAAMDDVLDLGKGGTFQARTER